MNNKKDETLINETDNIWKDESGVKYSQDKKQLLSVDCYEWDWGNPKLHKYCIQEGIRIISDRAFSSFWV